ncbi:MAG: type II toxin-antitoxin system Phd/YefM family antitoxin [Terriglobales bacterium]
MISRLSATEAARRFSELLNRAHYRGETFQIERGGKPVCEIVPVATPSFTGKDLADLLRSLPHPDEEYLQTVENLTRRQPKVAPSPWPR